MRPLVLTLPLLACGCGGLDSVLCGTSTCEFSAREWDVLRSLAGLPAQPPLDTSNRYANDPAAAALGQQLYFEPRASGTSTLIDTLGRPVPFGRAAKGAPLGISCATCHDPRAAGSDLTSMPNTTSIGAGWYDVNGQQTVNAAYYGITYWNGRNDSLWAQIVAVEESTVSMGSNRLALTWMLGDHYRAAYDAVFTDTPLPVTGASEALAAQVTANGQCALDAGACPEGCRAVASTPASCWPRFPLRGRPGATPGCQPDSTTEPFFDAYDCMDLADQKAATQVLVNFSKAIAAYEQRLVSRDSAFDRFMAAGPKSDLLTPAQQRGARLFVGKAACVECHSTPLFSDSEFHNVGVPQEGEAVPTEADCPEGSKVCDCVAGVKCLPWGARDGLAKLRTNGFRRDSPWSDDPSDTSRLGYLKRPLTDELIGAWRTPSLRDVALTAPYMHDGAYPSLTAVIEAYNTGGSAAGYSGQRSVQVQPLLLTVDEESDLVAFLGSLTGAPLPSELISKPELPP